MFSLATRAMSSAYFTRVNASLLHLIFFVYSKNKTGIGSCGLTRTVFVYGYHVYRGLWIPLGIGRSGRGKRVSKCP